MQRAMKLAVSKIYTKSHIADIGTKFTKNFCHSVVRCEKVAIHFRENVQKEPSKNRHSFQSYL